MSSQLPPSSMPKFIVDHEEDLTEILETLYSGLPQDLRVKGNVLSASDVLIEVAEYMAWLKVKAEENNNLNRKNETQGQQKDNEAGAIKQNVQDTSKPRFITNESVKVQNICLPPGGELVTLPGGGQAIALPSNNALQTKPPNTTPTIIQLPPGAKLPITPKIQLKQFASSAPITNPTPTPTILSTTATSNVGGKSLLKPQHHVTLITKDRDGITRPVRIPAGTIVASEKPDASKPVVNAAAPIIKVTQLPSSTASPKIVSTETLNELKTDTPPWLEPGHGLTCIPGCSCPLNDDEVPLRPAYRMLLLKYLRGSVIVDKVTEVSKDLTLFGFKNEVFNAIIDGLQRKEMHAFLKFFRPGQIEQRSIEGNCCVFKTLVAKNLPGKRPRLGQGGIARIEDKDYSIHQLVFKLFRREVSEIPLERLMLISRTECKTSKNSNNGSGVYCINPWHFERAPEYLTNTRNATEDHVCQTRLRIERGKSAYVCPFCQASQMQFDPDGVIEAAPMAPPKKSYQRLTINGDKITRHDEDLESDKNTIVTEPEAVFIKEEPTDEACLEEMEKDFEVALEKEVKKEIVEEEEPSDEPNLACEEANDGNESEEIDQGTILDPDDPEWEPQGRLVINEKKPSPKKATTPPKSVDEEVKTSRKRESVSKLRCWKCYNWFDSKEIKTHSCLPKLMDVDTAGYFCCQYCGLYENSIEAATKHVKVCRSLGFKPIQDLVERGKPIQQIGPKSKRRRKNEDSADITCKLCGITFVNGEELSLHKRKPKCRSIECNVCKKYFANTMTHQKHECNPVSDEDTHGLLVIKFEAYQEPLRCLSCRGIFESEELLRKHYSTETECPKCQRTFGSPCAVFKHTCPSSFKCSRCDKTFLTVDLLETHRLSCSPWLA